MRNKESSTVQKCVDKIIAKCVTWNTTKKGPPPSFAEMDLRKARFIGVNLSGISFRGSLIRGATFDNVNLSGADFEGAIVNDATFTDCNVDKTDFDRAIMTGSCFTKCVGGYTRFTDAWLARAVFDCCIMNKADFSHANLTAARFVGPSSEFNGACFDEAVGRRTQFEQVAMKEATFDSAVLTHASFYIADLTNASLLNTNLRGAFIENSALKGAVMRGANTTNITIYNGAKTLAGATLPHYQICPDGEFTAYKKVQLTNRTARYVLELLIPRSAERTSTLLGRKCRASKAKVVAVYINGKRHTKCSKTFRSMYTGSFLYKVGAWVRVEDFNPDPTVECTHGIHFFMTKAEAEAY